MRPLMASRPAGEISEIPSFERASSPRRRQSLEVVEAPESRLDPPEVDVSVLVHENVSEARKTLQPLRGLERDHAAREQAGRDLAVLVDRLLELAGQDVAARVEEPRRRCGGRASPPTGASSPPRGDPRSPGATTGGVQPLRRSRGASGERFSARTGTASLGPLTQVRLLDPPEMCRIHVTGDGPRHEAHALVLVATHEAGPARDDFVGQEGGASFRATRSTPRPEATSRSATSRSRLSVGGEPEKRPAMSASLFGRASPRTSEPKRYASRTSEHASRTRRIESRPSTMVPV